MQIRTLRVGEWEAESVRKGMLALAESLATVGDIAAAVGAARNPRAKPASDEISAGTESPGGKAAIAALQSRSDRRESQHRRPFPTLNAIMRLRALVKP
jgi:hypothetical protein